jgi:hypothetical protein
VPFSKYEGDDLPNIERPCFHNTSSTNQQSKIVNSISLQNRARILKRLWSSGIDSKEWIPPAYGAWRAGTTTLFLAPIDCLKIPSQYMYCG